MWILHHPFPIGIVSPVPNIIKVLDGIDIVMGEALDELERGFAEFGFQTNLWGMGIKWNQLLQEWEQCPI